MKTLKAIRDALVLRWENRRVEYMAWVSTGAVGSEIKEQRAWELEACIKDLEAVVRQSASSPSVDSRTPAVSSTDWLDAPGRFCEVLIRERIECGKPATHAYPAMGGGYMALCSYHAKKHPEAWPIKEI